MRAKLVIRYIIIIFSNSVILDTSKIQHSMQEKLGRICTFSRYRHIPLARFASWRSRPQFYTQDKRSGFIFREAHEVPSKNKRVLRRVFRGSFENSVSQLGQGHKKVLFGAISLEKDSTQSRWGLFPRDKLKTVIMLHFLDWSNWLRMNWCLWECSHACRPGFLICLSVAPWTGYHWKSPKD